MTYYRTRSDCCRLIYTKPHLIHYLISHMSILMILTYFRQELWHCIDPWRTRRLNPWAATTDQWDRWCLRWVWKHTLRVCWVKIEANHVEQSAPWLSAWLHAICSPFIKRVWHALPGKYHHPIITYYLLPQYSIMRPFLPIFFWMVLFSPSHWFLFLPAVIQAT